VSIYGTDYTCEHGEPPDDCPRCVPVPKPPLEFLSVKELRARVAAAGPRRWLLRGLWPDGDYGVFAGDMKAQKSWTVTDTVVSTASGTPWLGLVPVDRAGPVVMFVGEGGQADALRRIDAVCAARGIVADDLPITICCRAPYLSNAVHLGLMADQLDRERPILTSVDPFYLSAGGANGGDLYAMGQLLERPQRMCQEIGAALIITTHQNRREGRGAARITGAGPAEWGRVLMSATVKSRHLNKATTETTVITELDVIGGSIPGGRLRVVRRIVADDPDDLDSPLRYAVQCTAIDDSDGADDASGTSKMPPSRAKILEVLRDAGGVTVTVRTLVDRIVEKHGHGLTRETCSRELNALLADGLADRVDLGKGTPAEWLATEAATNADL
jgi:AAA domain